MTRSPEAVKQQLIKQTRSILSTEGYTSFSMRLVAKQCGIAPGTIYNYFHSKDEMVVACILDGWKEVTTSLAGYAQEHPNVFDQLDEAGRLIEGFAKENLAILKDAGAINSFYGHTSELYDQMVSRLVAILSPAIKDQAVEYDDFLPVILIENLIYCICRNIPAERLKGVFKPLFK